MLCNADAPERKLFMLGGHLRTTIDIPPVGDLAYPNMNLKRRLRLEAEKLYYARRQSIWIGTAVASRKAEGKPVTHLRELMSMNRNYIRALVSALDGMGWLGPVERISRRLENNG